MKFATKSESAIAALLDIHKNDNGTPVSIAAISKRNAISCSYLEQLLGKLKAAGLVKSTRGPGGGYRLARSADRIKILDIVSAVDGPSTVAVSTPLGAAMHLVLNFLSKETLANAMLAPF